MQVVGYDTGAADGEPALQLASEGTVTRQVLVPGEEIALGLGERHCAGRVDGERHEPCDRPRAPYCDRHAETWVCARCTGSCLKPEMDCHEPHAVSSGAVCPGYGESRCHQNMAITDPVARAGGRPGSENP
ncbi:MAG: hypothetical protein U5K37_06650 [Natrialbaceae archaeon]|nr:hypothetical protein [Natrialbaceae archaeon]